MNARTQEKRPGLELGQVVRRRAVFGRLQVYLKVCGSLGGAFLCEQTGEKLGVTHGVLVRFQDPAEYQGWGYPDNDRIWLFLEQDRLQVPEDIISVKAGDEVVKVPRKLEVEAAGDGAWIAFRAWKNKRGMRVVEAVFPLDLEHAGVFANLAVLGKLDEKGHEWLVRSFFEEVQKAVDGNRIVDPRGLTDALEVLGGASLLAQEWRELARVERNKIARMLTKGSDGPRRESTRAEASQGTGQESEATVLVRNPIKVRLILER